ncbi:asparaginase [Aminithiophilus ramosus]|uniref:Asparaginase n=1 Tax=Aminithiophilus ramosus TaxID=3029084 RepID=A0A9Q7A9B2_9BACT|nr:asparaginase [Aminithiophilus ramosus]QTX32806.1 asparaginase [Aminithiophilus ramosus]
MPQRDKIALVAAGGSMGMIFSERQEGHAPGLSAEDIARWLPEEIRRDILVVDWSHQPSSHFSIRMTTDLVEVLKKLVVDGVQGIVVTCGTDVLEEMAYLTDLLWTYPQPVIFTGAMRPSDLVGSDAMINLHQSLLAVRCEAVWGLGVLACFQDQLFAASEITEEIPHRRDPFAAPGLGPVGEIRYDRIVLVRRPKRPTSFSSAVTPAREVELVTAALGGGERLIAALAQGAPLDGLVLAGFGLGNVPPAWLPHIKTLLKNNVPLVVTSRCPQGTVDTLYGFEGSARRLLEFGVFSGGSRRPVQARLRLSVGLGAGLQGDDLRKYLLET